MPDNNSEISQIDIHPKENSNIVIYVVNVIAFLLKWKPRVP